MKLKKSAQARIEAHIDEMIATLNNAHVNELFSRMPSGKMLRSLLVLTGFVGGDMIEGATADKNAKSGTLSTKTADKTIESKIDSTKTIESKIDLTSGVESKIDSTKTDKSVETSPASSDLATKTLRLCAIIELIQIASLLHDDVIDESSLRRGAKTINHLYGNTNAIMLGDALYARAFYELALSFPASVAQSISLSVARLAVGEIEDVFLSEEFNASLDAYYYMIENKTAHLIASSLEACALLHNRSSKDARGYYEYGLNLGIAFQIIDDLLDVISTTKDLGKDAFLDFRSGKSTLPYIYLYERLDDASKERLLSYYKKRLDEHELAWCIEVLDATGAIAATKAKARDYIELAIASLPSFWATNPSRINEANDLGLRDIALAILQRSY